ncbi:type IV toxin-antitoxin system AbiEi family antitoxin domain-containing protein [Nocardioides sp. TF02-7]|uniref:type IV toxin-antitoxin system AbiEi family antitoxin domain-containing protein n=1 Tax=Nocardioides sp. TF02-7 TaxID=2917724 RepID=UPI001F062B1B|nr:type IV toxin-antitoxin system AbiEi family antitoxin domain-containing protein [Nocardioides sp. TF02-7]UMG94800.1 type IV toxin-antitoxin system AbiEi family antitoxin domain-containing protein [Nocardioides sp. TF02-7]
MDPRILAAFASHHGVLRRTQLLDLGMPPTEIRRLLRSGALVLLRRGAYTTREIWDAADRYVARPLLLARAAVALTRRAWVLSHDSAAHALGMAILDPRDPYVHLTRPGWTNAWTGERGQAPPCAVRVAPGGRGRRPAGPRPSTDRRGHRS